MSSKIVDDREREVAAAATVICMHSHLVPQQRTDKLGRTITRHMKPAGSVQSTSKIIPAPAAVAPTKSNKKKLLPATEWQYKTKNQYIENLKYHPDADLVEALRGLPETPWLSYTEVSLLEMMSIVSPENAIIIMHKGIETCDEAVDFLRDHGLEHLIVDRRDMMEKAISMRVHAMSIFSLSTSTEGIGSYNEDAFLGAALFSSYRTLDSMGKRENEHQVYTHATLAGEVNAEDVLTVGIKAIHQAEPDLKRPLLEAFKAIHTGTVAYDAKLLKSIVMIDGELETFQLMTEAVEANGVKFVKDMLKFRDAMEKNLCHVSGADTLKLYEGGLPADAATELMTLHPDADRAVALYREGLGRDSIHKTIADGWL